MATIEFNKLGLFTAVIYSLIVLIYGAAYGESQGMATSITNLGAIKSELLCQLDQPGLVTKGGWQWRATARGKHIAWFGIKSEGQAASVYVWLDGKPLFPIFTIYFNTLSFDPAGDRLAWWSNENTISIYEIPSKVVKKISCEECKSPASSLWFSGGLSQESWKDGRDSRPIFSPKGDRLLARAIVSGKDVIIIDGKKGPTFNEISDWGFDPTGSHFGYVAKDETQTIYLLDHKEVSKNDPSKWQTFQKTRIPARESPPLEWVGKGGDLWSPIANSSDGKHLAWVASKGQEDRRVIVDGVIISEHWDVPSGGEPTWVDNRTIRWVVVEEPIQRIHKVVLFEFKLSK